MLKKYIANNQRIKTKHQMSISMWEARKIEIDEKTSTVIVKYLKKKKWRLNEPKSRKLEINHKIGGQRPTNDNKHTKRRC